MALISNQKKQRRDEVALPREANIIRIRAYVVSDLGQDTVASLIALILAHGDVAMRHARRVGWARLQAAGKYPLR